MHGGRRGSLTLGVGVIAAVLLGAGTIWWIRPPGDAPTSGLLLGLLPVRSTLHSFARVDLDGAAPLEAAAVVLIPSFPGSTTSQYAEVIAQFDRWRRRYSIVYQRRLLGEVPVSVDAGRILGERDGVLFGSVTDGGRWVVRVVGQFRGRVVVLTEVDARERISLADPLVVVRGDDQALRWDGAHFVSHPLPAPAPPPVSVTWRYGFRHGAVLAHTDRVLLMPRQILRLQRIGGGTTPIIVPDSRLDIVENGYRARRPGTYSIRLLIPFTLDADAYVLTVQVAEP